MLDMGFINDVKFIIYNLPKVRHSMFFSATLSDSIKGIMNSFLINPVMIYVKSQETAVNVEQDIIRVNGQQKIEVLHDILIKDGFNKVLVFGRTKWGVQKLTDELIRRGFKAGAIHGNKNQNGRRLAQEHYPRLGLIAQHAKSVFRRNDDASLPTFSFRVKDLLAKRSEVLVTDEFIAEVFEHEQIG